MIVRIRIEPNAIREAIANSPDGGKEVLTRLATELRRHGAIYLIHEEDLKEVLRPLEPNLKPAVAKLWKKLLEDLRLWGRIVDVDTTPEEVGDVDLAILSAGSLPEGGRGRADGVHLSTAEEADRSPVIQQLRRLKYAENYKEGTDSERVWDERFASCTRISKRVTLVDKYLFGGTSGLNRELVPWVLTRLEQDCMLGLEVELIGALPTGAEPWQIRSLIADHGFGQSRLSSIKIWIAPWVWNDKVFDRKAERQVEMKRSGPHNRHIRFSCGAAFTLEEGFDRLWRRNRNGGQPKVWGSSGVTPHYVGSDAPALVRLAKIEKDLKRATRPARILDL